MGSTIHDVARLAGVSISTVSRVVNRTSPVADDKRLRVESAVRELHYSANPAAVSLLKGSTGGIGVLLPALGGEFFSELLYGLDTATQQHERILLVSPSHRNPSELTASLHGIVQRVDGLLIMSSGIEIASYATLLPSDLPVVYINSFVTDENARYLNFDNFGGMYSVGRHLIESGHRSIAFVSGPVGSDDAAARLEGLQKAVSECSDPITVSIVGGDFSLESGYAASGKILALADRPTAVLACNDLSAQGVLHGLREAGISVPTEMALAGFDDIPSASFMTPPLTTVNVPVRDLAIAALDHLVEAIESGGAVQPVRKTFDVELIVRESTSGFRPGSPR